MSVYPGMKSRFLGLPDGEKEEAFSLSCHDLGHWEAGFDWLTPISEIRDEIDDYLEKLYPSSHWDQIKSDPTSKKNAENLFLGGDISNELLAWYIEDMFDRISADSESNSSSAEHDVHLYQDGAPSVGIELKRIANSSQLKTYLGNFALDCQNRPPAPNYLLMNFYPVTTDVSQRTVDLVSGYGVFSPTVDKFYKRDNVFVGNIPAAYPRNSGDILPLRDTGRLLRTQFTLGT